MHKSAQRTFSFCLATALVALTLVANESVNAQETSNWAHWRGPEQSGISRETNLVDDWSLETGKNVAWKVDVGGRATPIILNGRVYLNCRTQDTENKVDTREQVICWDLKTGQELWRDKFNVWGTDIPSPRVGWAAMVGDVETGNVFVHSVSGMLRCYNPAGETVWEISLAEQYGKISGYGGRTQTPIIDEDRLIVSFMATNWGATKGPGPLHYYYAFDKKTGELQWVSAPGGQPKDTNYSCPVVAVINGERQLIGGNCDGHVYSINARSGKPIWSFKMSLRGLNTTPAVLGNNVYISHGEDNVDNAEFGRVQCIDATGKGDVTKTHSVWRHDGLKAGYTANVAKDGMVYVVSDTGNLYAYDAESGERLWDHDLGTVGKGSPVFADGKIYATEVNGKVWILKPSRQGCETLSKNVIPARVGAGLDEIYASPAIADGHVVLVTRDRTICITDKAKKAVAGEIKALPAEDVSDMTVDTIQLRPYETVVKAGSTTKYELHSFTANGRLISKAPATNLKVSEDLKGFTANGDSLVAPSENKFLAGTITAEVDGKTATARVRMLSPESTWKWDFTGYKGKRVPATWNRAFIKLQPFDLDGDTVLKVTGGAGAKGRPSHQIGIGVPQMKGYEVQADVRLTEARRQLPDIGISVHRYNLIMIGNTGKLSIESWPSEKRMEKNIKFRSDPDVWYTMKMKVDVEDGKAKISGKVWKRDEAEPTGWTIRATDPHPNLNGSPGLYYYSLADCYFDNVIVKQK